MEASVALAGALGICLIGGFLPWVNTEAAVVGAALLLPTAALPLLVVGAASAQVLAKSTVYATARWAPARMPSWAPARLERLRGLGGRRRTPLLTVLASSTIGVPPFYLVALACGTVAVPFRVFLSTAFAGMVVRYAVLAVATALVRSGL